jgi:hypothetical protein
MEHILVTVYKRTRDGFYKFTNINSIAHKLGWRSIDGFILYMEEEANIHVYERGTNYYLSEGINIREMNEFLKNEYNKNKSKSSGII